MRNYNYLSKEQQILMISKRNQTEATALSTQEILQVDSK